MESGIQQLGKALRRYEKVNGSPLPRGPFWLNTLTPAYGYAPKVPGGMRLEYGASGNRTYICLAPAIGRTASQTSLALLRKARRALGGNSQASLSQAGCAAEADDNSPNASHLTAWVAVGGPPSASLPGRTPAYYATDLSTWPQADFINNSGNTRVFQASPNTRTPRFADVFFRQHTSTGNVSHATVRDILTGYAVNNSGVKLSKQSLQIRSGYSPLSLELGREVLAAYISASDPERGHPNYPLTPSQVVALFNATAPLGGTYAVSETESWDAGQVIQYLNSLHTSQGQGA